MKRLSLLVVFFYACTIAQPPQVKANPAIGLLLPGVIGATILAMGGTYYAMKNPGAGYSFDGHSVTTSLWAYNKIAGMARDYLVGKAVTGVLDLKRAYDDGILKGYLSLQKLVENYFPPINGMPQPGDIFDLSILSSYPGYSESCATGNYTVIKDIPRTAPGLIWGALIGTIEFNYCSSYFYYVKFSDPGYPAGYVLGQQREVLISAVPDQEINYPPPAIPEILPEKDIVPLAGAIANQSGVPRTKRCVKTA